MVSINNRNIVQLSGRKTIVSFFCGFILSSTSLIGVMIENKNETSYFMVGLSFVISIVLLTIICYWLFRSLSNERKVNVGRDYKSGEFSFGKTWIMITMCWLPYCIINFPARIGGGSINQIKQFYGLDTRARQLSSIIYEGHYITNHHPALLTYFYGMFFKIGDIIKKTNLVVFIMSCVILLISSLSMSYMLIVIKRYINKKIYFFVCLFLCVYPIFGMYSYTICKDNLYTDALIVFYTCILQIVFEKGAPFDNKKFRYLFFIISALIPFLKNQGIIIVIISLFFISLANKNIGKYLRVNIGIILLLYIVLFNHILMPILKIAPGGKQEILSIPFQQTALYVKQYGEELNEEEYEAINSVLPVNQIASLYDKNLADPVKFTYRQEATINELVKYFHIWVKQFFKHPGVYFKAFFGITDGYYYIAYTEMRLDFIPLKMDFTGISVPNWVWNLQTKQDNFWNNIIKIPIIGYLFHNAIFSWIMILSFFYCIYIKEIKYILIILPVLLSFGICLLSPANGSVRYALPIIYAFPIYICIFAKKIDKCN